MKQIIIAFLSVMFFCTIALGQPLSGQVKQQILDDSILSQGDISRIMHTMKKASQGKEVVISAIGGSITEGSCCWNTRFSNLVAKWWQAKFPQAKIKMVNAAIGASSSNLASHRVSENLMKHKPDFVVCEFAVNDGRIANVHEMMEGLTRQMMKSPEKPAVMLLFMCGKSGKSRQPDHKMVGDYYDLPMVSYQDSVFKQIKAGNLTWKQISDDTVHPNQFGHQLVTDIITNFLEIVYDEFIKLDKLPEIKPLGQPKWSDVYEYTKMYNSNNSKPCCNKGWTANQGKAPYAKFLSKGWTANEPGSEMVFNVKATAISLSYHIYKGDVGMISVQVDDNEPVVLDGYMPHDWGNGMSQWKSVASGLTPGKHKVKIKLLDKKHKDSNGYNFRVQAVMAAGVNR